MSNNYHIIRNEYFAIKKADFIFFRIIYKYIKIIKKILDLIKKYVLYKLTIFLKMGGKLKIFAILLISKI